MLKLGQKVRAYRAFHWVDPDNMQEIKFTKTKEEAKKEIEVSSILIELVDGKRKTTINWVYNMKQCFETEQEIDEYIDRKLPIFVKNTSRNIRTMYRNSIKQARAWITKEKENIVYCKQKINELQV